MPDFYFITFGSGHPGYPGYVRVTAKSHQRAREKMFEVYGNRWCGSYANLGDVDMFDRTERDRLVDND